MEKHRAGERPERGPRPRVEIREACAEQPGAWIKSCLLPLPGGGPRPGLHPGPAQSRLSAVDATWGSLLDSGGLHVIRWPIPGTR